MTRIIGIDLGTTNSCVAVLDDKGQPKTLAGADGERTTPSWVAWSPQGQVTVGIRARRQAVTNASTTVYGTKRLIGRKVNSDDVSWFARLAPFRIVAAPNGDAWVRIHGQPISPQEVAAHILRQVRRVAEEALGEPVTRAVVTVPAYFDDAQRQATKDAGRIAGLEVLRIINEPTAAALAYGIDKKGSETILVWDLGGGTFDISILEVGDGVFEVKSTKGDTLLGGDDYDQKVVDWLVAEFRKDQGIDLSGDKQALQRLTEAAEKAKIELSSLPQTNINLPFITADASGPKHLDITLTRADFERLVSDLTDRMIKPFKDALSDAKIDVKQIDEIVMVGGSTRMPLVAELVKKLTGKETLNQSVNPDEVVAIGAAIQAGVLAGEVRDVVLLDVTPLSLGLETLGGVFTKLIDRNTTIPTKKSQIFTTAEDGQTSVDIAIFQGEREMARDNKALGQFRLEGIPAAPRGIPQIEVAFNIDANGIVAVSAKDLGTGKEQTITITATTNLSKEEVDRMVRDAESSAAEDTRKKEEAEARNKASSLIYSTEKSLKEIGDKLDETAKADVEKALAELHRVSENGTVADVKAATDALEAASFKLAEALYQKTGAAAGANGATNGAGAPHEDSTAPHADDVIDAEFKEAK